MKKCNYCNIYISGKRNHCPLCNNALEGEATSPHWPGMKRLRLKGFIYKLQAFLVLAMNAGMDSGVLDPTNRDMMGMMYATEAMLGLDEYCMEYISAYREGKFGPVKTN